MVSERKRGPGKEKVMILSGGNIPQVKEDSGNLRAETMLGNAQGPWQVASGTGSCKQLHNMNWHSFLPNVPGPAGTSQQRIGDLVSIALWGSK